MPNVRNKPGFQTPDIVQEIIKVSDVGMKEYIDVNNINKYPDKRKEEYNDKTTK